MINWILARNQTSYVQPVSYIVYDNLSLPRKRAPQLRNPVYNVAFLCDEIAKSAQISQVSRAKILRLF